MIINSTGAEFHRVDIAELEQMNRYAMTVDCDMKNSDSYLMKSGNKSDYKNSKKGKKSNFQSHLDRYMDQLK